MHILLFLHFVSCKCNSVYFSYLINGSIFPMTP